MESTMSPRPVGLKVLTGGSGFSAEAAAELSAVAAASCTKAGAWRRPRKRTLRIFMYSWCCSMALSTRNSGLALLILSRLASCNRMDNACSMMVRQSRTMTGTPT